jgi:hypothetical protein
MPEPVKETEDRLRARLRRAMGAEPAPIVIGLGGYAEHGKDALADALVTRHGFMKFGMSDALHEILLVLDPRIPQVSFPDRHMSYREHVQAVGYTQAKTHPEVRRLLRTLGTEVGRDMLYPDIWVAMAGKKIRAARDAGTSVVVTGIRYPNEIGLIALHGGTTVWVDRPGHRIPDTTHTSETTVSMSDFGLIAINDGTLADLAHEADGLIDQILASRARRGR